MSLKAKSGGSGEITLAPEGTHVARCYAIVDMGTQETFFKGERKMKHQVKFSWELPEEKHVFSEEKGEQPFSVHSTFTVSTNKNSNLRPILESWRGRKLTAKEEAEVDLGVFLGKTCMINIVHNKVDKDGESRTYANVGSVMAKPKAMECPAAINEPILFDIGAENQNEVFDKLLPFLQDKIAKSEEWQHQIKTNGSSLEPLAEEEVDVVVSNEDEVDF